MKRILVKGMLKTPVESRARLLKEARELDGLGADVIRVAIEKESSLPVIRQLKKAVKARIEADVHFDPRLTIGSIEQGTDLVRFNPLNITDRKAVKTFIDAATAHRTHVRIGINSGGFKGRFTDESLAREMVRLMRTWVRFFEKQGFHDLSLSFKAQSVRTTVLANRQFWKECDRYGMDLGVTATGPYEEGLMKSALALGALFSDGIGDSLRLSLNAPSTEEVRLAKLLLQFMGFGQSYPEIISCPTCSRTCVDLRRRVESFRKFMYAHPAFRGKPVKIALMGCVVNGPGEASQADAGVAFAKKGGHAALFKKGKIVGRIREEQYRDELVKLFERET